MRRTLLLGLGCLFFQFTNAQISEGNWLVGGSGSFLAYSKNRTVLSPASTQNVKALRIQLSPSIGYFVKDKFAVGLKPTLYYETGRAGDAFAPNGSLVGSGGDTRVSSFYGWSLCALLLAGFRKSYQSIDGGKLPASISSYNNLQIFLQQCYVWAWAGNLL